MFIIMITTTIIALAPAALAWIQADREQGSVHSCKPPYQQQAA